MVGAAGRLRQWRRDRDASADREGILAVPPLTGVESMLTVAWRPLVAGLAFVTHALAAHAQVAGQHPDPRHVTRSAIEHEVRLTGASAGASALLPTAVLARIGTEDGKDATVFGNMVSAAIVDDSTIAIVDGTISEVRLFTRDGRHLQTIGREGSGPGEFRSAVAVVRAPDGALIVADSRRMLQYFYRNGTSYEHRRSVTLSFGVRSMCFLGGNLFINGGATEDGKVLRMVDGNGVVLRAFGEIYRSGSAIINYQVAQGRLACDEARQLIYYMAGALVGDVRAFRPTGEELWRVHVGDYRTNRVLEQSGGYSVEPSPTGVHMAGNVVALADRGVLAQWMLLSRAQREARELPTEVHSVLIDAASGRPSYLGTGLPLVKDARRDLALGFFAEPVPRMEVRGNTPGAP